MLQYKLSFDQRVIELEKNHQWYTAAKLLYKLWLENPNKINNLICAGTQCWYGILSVTYDRYNHKLDIVVDPDEEESLHIMLSHITQYGFAHFSQDALFNAYFGYMIKVMPYFFFECDGNYDEWQRKGINMMRRAFELEPDNLFAEAMYHEPDCYNNAQYFEVCKKIWMSTTPNEWGNSEVQQYFFRILCGASFYPEAYRTGAGLREP